MVSQSQCLVCRALSLCLSRADVRMEKEQTQDSKYDTAPQRLIARSREIAYDPAYLVHRPTCASKDYIVLGGRLPTALHSTNGSA